MPVQVGGRQSVRVWRTEELMGTEFKGTETEDELKQNGVLSSWVLVLKKG